MKTPRLSILAAIGLCAPAMAQTAILFDFDSAPLHTPLPLNLTVSGLTAQFSATGQGYSIQQANTMGFTPAGFAGLCIYPSSIYGADLMVSFSQTLTGFSIMFAPQELACDDTATMQVTAYMNGGSVGSATAQAPVPGTWPTGTLSYNNAGGFNSVTVHYLSRPPTCQDYGGIFLADNMIVTVMPVVCYPNCDASTTPPILNANDFQCFLNEFAGGFPYANCDGSTVAPVLTANDFQCFLNSFAAGCT